MSNNLLSNLHLLQPGNYVLYKQELCMILSVDTESAFTLYVEPYVGSRAGLDSEVTSTISVDSQLSDSHIVPLGSTVKLRCISTAPSIGGKPVTRGNVYTLASIHRRATPYGGSRTMYCVKELPGRLFAAGRFTVILPDEHLETTTDYSVYEVVCSNRRANPKVFTSKLEAETYAREKSEITNYTYSVRVLVSSYKQGYKKI